MKSIIVLSALCLTPRLVLAAEATSNAQAATTSVAPASPTRDAAGSPQVLVGKEGVVRHHGWYVAPSIGATRVDGESAVTAGVRGAWLLDRTFGLGLAGTAFTNDTTETASPGTIDGGYGGLMLQYVLRPNDIVHASFDATIGGGAVCAGGTGREGNHCEQEHGFFMVESIANLEVNLARHVRLTLGGGYRFASAESRSPLSGGDLGGLVVRSSVMLGQF